MEDLEEKYLLKYYNVSREELESIKEYTRPDLIEFILDTMHEDRERKKINGRPALDPGPLVHVLSVCVHPKEVRDKPLSIYGSIIAENHDSIYRSILKHDLYNRKCTDPEIIGTSGGTLSLSGPDYMCDPDYAFIPMFKNRIVVKLFDGDNNAFAIESFTLDDTEIEGGYEVVKSISIPCKQGFMLVKYVAIPFGVNCRIEVKFDNRGSEKHKFINVNGEVVASFINTYGGNYDSEEECVLFQKQSNAFERVEIDGVRMQLSRCWVAVPAYSSLVLRLNLSDDTGRKLVNDAATLLPEPTSFFGKLFKLDGLYIQVLVTCFPPLPLRPHQGNDVPKCLPKIHTENLEEMDIDEDEKTCSDDETTCSDDETSSSDSMPWAFKRHKKMMPSPAFEIYSVFIGLEKLNASAMLQIHGSIQVLSDNDKICDILKRDESEAFAVSQNMNFMPIQNGSRVYEDGNDLEMKVDLKDADSRLAIKGRMFYGGRELEDDTWYRDKQLCCLIQGRGGFAAVHYSIFNSAVAANINVYLNIKKMGGCAMIYGSIFCQYRYYYYSSRYHKDCYRSALFVRNEGNSVQLNVEGSIPLSRSFVVVPTYSPLVINVVDLSGSVSGNKLSSCTEEIEIEIGVAHKTIEKSDYDIRIVVDWCEVK